MIQSISVGDFPRAFSSFSSDDLFRCIIFSEWLFFQSLWIFKCLFFLIRFDFGFFFYNFASYNSPAQVFQIGVHSVDLSAFYGIFYINKFEFMFTRSLCDAIRTIQIFVNVMCIPHIFICAPLSYTEQLNKSRFNKTNIENVGHIDILCEYSVWNHEWNHLYVVFGLLRWRISGKTP